MISLPKALVIVATLVFFLVVGERVFLGVWMLPPLLVVIPSLLLLSFGYKFWPRSIALLTLFLSFLPPIAAVFGYLQGQLIVLIPILDTIMFGWLAWTAFRVLGIEKQGTA